MKEQLLRYSYDNKLSHIPSAMSMIDYIDVLFTNRIVTPDDFIILGKPFGSQAYYLVWQKLGYLTTINHLNVGVKHDEIAFVDYSEETIGNALGVAAGIAITTDRLIWVNISDAALQMGNVLEAIQFIGQNNLKNIFLTIDYNNAQVTGNTNDIISVRPTIQFFKEYNWFVQEVDGHDHKKLKSVFTNIVNNTPNVVFCHTIKGHGCNSIATDIPKWHYRKIGNDTELQLLVSELNEKHIR
jgi:transketolase